MPLDTPAPAQDASARSVPTRDAPAEDASFRDVRFRDASSADVPARDAVGPGDVLGVPLLPPAGAARIGERLRAGLARAHRAAAPPPGRLLEAALGGLDLAALAAVCELELPDRLTGPTRLPQLAAELGVATDRLDRLVRFAATRGWVRLDRRGRVRPTRLTAFLRRDHPGGWRAWIEFAAGGEVAAALGSLVEGLRPDGDAFAAANGAPFFAWMQQHPDRHATFDRAMAAGGRMHGLLLARALDWRTSRRVCDVGGGDGTLLGVLQAQHPHLDGVLLDLPGVVARATPRPRLAVVGGDAFVAVPPGCDTYLFVNVLHDWDDEAAVTLLRRAATAAADTADPNPDLDAARTATAGAAPDAPRTTAAVAVADPDADLDADPDRDVLPRIVVVESEAHTRPRDGLAVRADLLMLALTPGGRERTTEEIGALAVRAGLRRRRSHRLPTGDLAHVLTR
jgi:hypothetical protein